MKLQTIILLAACALTVSAVRAQEGLPRKVENVKLLDLEGNAAKLPYFGEKNLMISMSIPTGTSRTRISPSNSSRTTVPTARTYTVSA